MFRFIVRHTFLVAVLVPWVTAPASATELFVDGLRGDDANAGLAIATAKRTIQAAVDLATTPGDVVSILPGEYLQGFTMGVAQSGVTIRALGEVVLVNAPGVVSGVTGARVEGITWRLFSSQLSIDNSSDVVVERCRFIEPTNRGLNLVENTFVRVRECLFADSNRFGVRYQNQTNVVVERCTFARGAFGAVSLVAGVPILIRNCALFENALGSSGTASFDFCDFFGEPSPGGTNITADPLFVDPDNRVYTVRAGSPLLNQGQDGGPIGAFGQGLHTAKDVSKDEPFQSATAWDGWVDSAGVPLSASSLVELNAQNEVILKVAVTSTAIYSPVFDTGSQFTVIRSVDFAVFEDTTLAPGSREIIDFDAVTPEREIRIRTSQAGFAQDPSSGPAFEVVDKQVAFKKRAQFVQLELVLRADGD